MRHRQPQYNLVRPTHETNTVWVNSASTALPPKVWNPLTPSLKTRSALASFKTALKIHLQEGKGRGCYRFSLGDRWVVIIVFVYLSWYWMFFYVTLYVDEFNSNYHQEKQCRKGFLGVFWLFFVVLHLNIQSINLYLIVHHSFVIVCVSLCMFN